LTQISQLLNPNIDILFFIWFFVLPALAIIFLILAPIFWFFIVPKIARTITWARLKKCITILLADDMGWVQLVFSKEHLPEGVVETTRSEGDWRFLPRPKWKSLKSKSNPGDTASVEEIILKKFTWKDLGKPFWIGYAGKVALMNPATLAGMEQTNESLFEVQLKKMQDYILSLPESTRQTLLTLMGELKESLKVKPITLVDPRKIKEVVPQMYTPSQVEAIAVNRELKGMKKRGKEYGKLVIGLAAIIGLVILGIIVVSFLMR